MKTLLGVFLTLCVVTSALAQEEQVFVHRATPENSTTNSTFIDHPLTNARPSVFLLATPSYNPDGSGGVHNNHNIGVWYDGGRRQWAVFNQDLAAMPAGAAFNIAVLDGSETSWYHRATASNTISNSTFFNRSQTAGNDAALIFITPNYNPSGVGGVYNNHATGVWYNGQRQQWAVFNQDLAGMPAGASFNAKVLPAGESVFVHRATAANRVFHATYLDNPRTNGNPNAVLLITPNFNPGRTGNVYNNRRTGVMYDSQQRKWAIFNQDSAVIPPDAAFNVAVFGGVTSAPRESADAGDIRVTGIEVTQAVQVFPGNSVPLVGYKKTAVRVYVQSSEGRSGPWTGVTARLNVRNVSGTNGGRDIPSRQLVPVNGRYGVIAVSPLGSTRTTLNDSFLFLLDPDQTAPGERHLQVELSSLDGRGETDRSNNTLSMNARFGQSLSFSMIGGRYANADPYLAAAPFSNYEAHRRFVENTFPVSNFWIVPLPGDPAPAMTNDDGAIAIGNQRYVIKFGTVIENAEAIVVPAYVCLSGTRNAAGEFHGNARVTTETRAEAICGNITAYTGQTENYINGHLAIERTINFLYPGGAVRAYSLQPEQSCMCGWCCNGSNGNQIGRGHDHRFDVGSTMAHELGHSWGMDHIQAPPAHLNDGPWEDYPHAHAAIGPQTGISFAGTGVALVPPSTGEVHMHDFMTYGAPNWISPYTYCKLMNWISGGRMTCSAATQRADQRRDDIQLARSTFPSLLAQVASGDKNVPSLYVAGHVDANGSVSLAPFELRAATAGVTNGKTWSVILEGPDGEILGERTFDLVSRDGKPGEPIPFSVIIPWNDRTATVSVNHGGKRRAARTVSTSDPVVTIDSPQAGASLSGKQRISWKGSDADGDALSYTVDYSVDGGASWVPLGVLIRATSLTADFDSVAGSETAALRVRASDGIRTTESRSAVFRVPRKAPRLTTTPVASHVAFGDGSVLEASAFDWEDGSITDPSSYRWTSDRDGEIGTGRWLVLSNLRLSAGTHSITVSVSDTHQTTARATWQVDVPSTPSLTHGGGR